MITTDNNLIRVKEYQMDQNVGKETIVQRELSYQDLMVLITTIKAITRFSIGNKTKNITTKIISGQSTLYDWYDNKFSGL